MADAVIAATPTPISPQALPAAVDSAPVTQATASSPSLSPTIQPSPDTSGVGVVKGQEALASAELPAPDSLSPDDATKVVDTKTAPADKSILGAELEKTPDDQVKVEPPVDTKQTDADLPLPIYQDFTVPEGVQPDAERLSNFSKMLGEFEKAKPDHDGFQKFGQDLIDFHASGLKNAVDTLNQQYAQMFEQRKGEWRDAFFKDPQIGGNRQETTLKAAVDAIRIHGGNADQQAEFRTLMDETGVGNHPAMIRMLANINTNLKEGRPLPAQSPMPDKLSKLERMYGKKS